MNGDTVFNRFVIINLAPDEELGDPRTLAVREFWLPQERTVYKYVFSGYVAVDAVSPYMAMPRCLAGVPERMQFMLLAVSVKNGARSFDVAEEEVVPVLVHAARQLMWQPWRLRQIKTTVQEFSSALPRVIWQHLENEFDRTKSVTKKRAPWTVNIYDDDERGANKGNDDEEVKIVDVDSDDDEGDEEVTIVDVEEDGTLEEDDKADDETNNDEADDDGASGKEGETEDEEGDDVDDDDDDEIKRGERPTKKAKKATDTRRIAQAGHIAGQQLGVPHKNKNQRRPALKLWAATIVNEKRESFYKDKKKPKNDDERATVVLDYEEYTNKLTKADESFKPITTTTAPAHPPAAVTTTDAATAVDANATKASAAAQALSSLKHTLPTSSTTTTPTPTPTTTTDAEEQPQWLAWEIKMANGYYAHWQARARQSNLPLAEKQMAQEKLALAKIGLQTVRGMRTDDPPPCVIHEGSSLKLYKDQADLNKWKEATALEREAYLASNYAAMMLWKERCLARGRSTPQK